MSSSETDMDTNHLRITDEELQADLDALQAEALGWLPLGDGAYLHAGGLAATRDDGVVVIDVVGVPTSAGLSEFLCSRLRVGSIDSDEPAPHITRQAV